MLSKKDCVMAAAVGYLVLILFFNFMREKLKFGVVCSNDSGCIRFCCRNESTCNEKYIRGNYFTPIVDSKELIYKIMFGSPDCPMELVEESGFFFFEVTDVKIFTTLSILFQHNRMETFGVTSTTGKLTNSIVCKIQ